MFELTEAQKIVLNAIEEHFNALRRKGFIKTLKGTARGIIIVDREV